MSKRNTDRVGDAVTDVATEWFQRLQDDDVPAATREAFADWLAESPLHASEFLQLTELWSDLGGIDAKRELDIDALIADARRDSNVEALHDGGRRRERQGRRLVWPAGLAAVAALVAGFLWLGGDDELATDYVTERGEQRSFSLDDGTLVHLNTQTSIRVHYEHDARRIELLRGEALFDVATDAARPFTVSDHHLLAQALGTQFNVYRRNDATRVTVLEGTVAVSARAASNSSGITPVQRVELIAGEQAAVSVGSAVTRVSVDVERVTAWTTRRLIFEEDVLADVVGEFNRYNQAELRLAGPALAAERISGVFNADDPQALVNVLNRLFGVTADVQPDGTLLLSRPESI